MPRGGTVRYHRHRLARGMAWRVQDLHVEHGRETAEPLRTDTHGVDRIEYVDAQLFDIALRAALLELAHVDGIHQALLGKLHAMFRGAADADAQHPRRTPARAHGGDLFQHPVDDIVRRVHHLELRLVLAATALGSHVNADRIAGDHLNREHARRIVACIATRERRIGKDRRAQLVVRMIVGAANAFIDDFLQGAFAVEAAAHAPFDEDVDDTGVLADRPVPFGAHAAVRQDLRDCILCRGAFLGLVGIAQGADVIHRVVVRNILEGVGDALDKVVFADDSHVAHRRKFPCCRFALPDRRVTGHRSKRLAQTGHAPKGI